MSSLNCGTWILLECQHKNRHCPLRPRSPPSKAGIYDEKYAQLNDIFIEVIINSRPTLELCPLSRAIHSTVHCITIQGGSKSKPLPNDQKIVLKPVNEIRFMRQIKVIIKHHNIIRWYYIFYA